MKFYEGRFQSTDKFNKFVECVVGEICDKAVPDLMNDDLAYNYVAFELYRRANRLKTRYPKLYEDICSEANFDYVVRSKGAITELMGDISPVLKASYCLMISDMQFSEINLQFYRIVFNTVTEQYAEAFENAITKHYNIIYC